MQTWTNSPQTDKVTFGLPWKISHTRVAVSIHGYAADGLMRWTPNQIEGCASLGLLTYRRKRHIDLPQKGSYRLSIEESAA